MNSDPNFRLYRRFGKVRNRLLLFRQYEIQVLEARLKALDEQDGNDDERKILNASIDCDKDAESERVTLFEELDRKLEHYGMQTLV